MKVRIGSIEIIDPTWDELEELVARFGGKIELDQDREHASTSHEIGRRNEASGTGRPCDRVVLERLVTAGTTGVPTKELGEILGRLGKSIRPGLLDWARRIGLVHDEGIDPFEECRTGSRRGVRLRGSFQPVAQELLSGRR